MKKLATILATVGVLAIASAPVLANASTVHNHANTLGYVSSYSVNNILPNNSSTNTFGTSTLTADNTNQQFFYQISPSNTSMTYTYWLEIDYYSDYTYSNYLGKVTIPTFSGAGVQSGYAAYPIKYLDTGGYYAKIYGLWNGSDGSQGYVAGATTPFVIN